MKLGQCEVADDKITELFNTGNELKIDGLMTQNSTKDPKQYTQGNSKVTYDEYMNCNKSEEVAETHEQNLMTSSQKKLHNDTYFNKESDKIQVIEGNIKELDTSTDEIKHNLWTKANNEFSESQKDQSINYYNNDNCKDNTSLFNCDLCEDIYSDEKEMLDHKNIDHEYTTPSQSIPQQPDKIRLIENDIIEMGNFTDVPDTNNISEKNLHTKENNEYSKSLIRTHLKCANFKCANCILP